MTKKIIKITVIVLSVIMFVTVFAICMGIFFNKDYENAYEINIKLTEKCDSEKKAYDQIISLCEDYIGDRSLTHVKTNIDGSNIGVDFYFVRYIDHSAEGGRIEAAKVSVDLNEQIIRNVETFKGSGKKYSHQLPGLSGNPIKNLDILNYREVIDDYIKNQDAISKSDKWEIMYFCDNEDRKIVKNL